KMSLVHRPRIDHSDLGARPVASDDVDARAGEGERPRIVCDHALDQRRDLIPTSIGEIELAEVGDHDRPLRAVSLRFKLLPFNAYGAALAGGQQVAPQSCATDAHVCSVPVLKADRGRVNLSPFAAVSQPESPFPFVVLPGA